MSIVILKFLLAIVYLSIVFLHLSRKNSEAVFAYALQSLAIAVILFNSYLETRDMPLLLVVILILVVKVILAPWFFNRLIKQHELAFSVSTYLNAPLTLVFIAGLTFVAYTEKLLPLTTIIPANQSLLALALSCMFLSLFLIVNRRGALSQIIGVLSFEGSIVSFIIFAGLEQSPALQAGITFNILVWTIISTIFASMIFKKFGTLNVTDMKNLKD